MKIEKFAIELIIRDLIILLITTIAYFQIFSQDLGLLENLVASSVTYKYGKNRQNLTAIEEIVRKSQSLGKRKEIERIFAKYLTNEQSTVEFKEFICRQLWYIGTAESVNSVATLLTNENTIGWGCYALTRNPTREATQALLKALESATESRKAIIIAALGQKRDPVAVQSLTKYCFYKDPEIAGSAVIALGQIASKDSIETLWRVYASDNKDLSEQAAHSLILCGEHLSKSGNQKDALEIYTKIYSLNQSLSVKVAAMRGIVLNSKDNGLDFFLKNLKSDNHKDQIAAIGAIGLVENPVILRQIAKAIVELPLSVQPLVINILADKKEQSLLPVVRSLLNSQDEQVRLESVKAIGIVGDSSCVSVLVNFLSRAEHKEKAFAKNSLSIMNNRGVDKEIVNLITKVEAQTQIDLIDVIVSRGISDAVPHLIKLCRQSNPEVQKATLRAIGKLGEPSILPELIKLTLDINDDKARAEGEAAVIIIASKIKDKNKKSSFVIKQWAVAKDVKSKESIIRMAGGIADRTALEFLSVLASKQEGEIQELAIREISRWEDPEAIPVLENLYKNTRNTTHRALTFRTYVRLLGSASDLSPDVLVNHYDEALKESRNIEEKRLVLAGLASVPAIGALNLALKMYGENEVKNESAQAILSISASIYRKDPQAAKNAVTSILQPGVNDNIQQQAKLLLKQIEEIGAYIFSWEVAGPYSVEGKNYDALFDLPFPPEQNGSNVKWSPIPFSGDPKRPYVIDLLRIFGGEQRVAYARCYINSPVEQKVRLELGSDDGAKVWLNGKLIYSLNIARPLTPNSDRVEILLNKGWNTLMLKITQNNLAWEFSARIVTLDGKMIDGLKYSVKKE